MFGSLGMPELVIIFVIALIVFGPRKLPELGKSLGKSLAEFKRASNELRNSLEEEIRVEEERDRAPKPAPAPTVQEPACIKNYLISDTTTPNSATPSTRAAAISMVVVIFPDASG